MSGPWTESKRDHNCSSTSRVSLQWRLSGCPLDGFESPDPLSLCAKPYKGYELTQHFRSRCPCLDLGPVDAMGLNHFHPIDDESRLDPRLSLSKNKGAEDRSGAAS